MNSENNDQRYNTLICSLNQENDIDGLAFFSILPKIANETTTHISNRQKCVIKSIPRRKKAILSSSLCQKISPSQRCNISQTRHNDEWIDARSSFQFRGRGGVCSDWIHNGTDESDDYHILYYSTNIIDWVFHALICPNKRKTYLEKVPKAFLRSSPWWICCHGCGSINWITFVWSMVCPWRYQLRPTRVRQRNNLQREWILYKFLSWILPLFCMPCFISSSNHPIQMERQHHEKSWTHFSWLYVDLEYYFWKSSCCIWLHEYIA